MAVGTVPWDVKYSGREQRGGEDEKWSQGLNQGKFCLFRQLYRAEEYVYQSSSAACLDYFCIYYFFRNIPHYFKNF